MLRDEEPPGDLLIVLRAIGGDLDSAVMDVTADAVDSGKVYVVERGSAANRGESGPL